MKKVILLTAVSAIILVFVVWNIRTANKQKSRITELENSLAEIEANQPAPATFSDTVKTFQNEPTERNQSD